MSEILVHIINHMDYGGAQKIVYCLINGLSQKYRIVLICKPGVYSKAFHAHENVTIIDRNKLSIFSLYALFNSLRRQCSKLIIHTHNRSDILIKYLLYSNDFHVHTFHSAYPNKNYLYYFFKPQFSISVSKTVQDYLHHYNIPSTLIYNGVNDMSLALKEYNGEFKSRKKKLLYVGRLGGEKGLFQILHALKEYRHLDQNFDFTLIGDGKIKKKLEEFCLLNEMDHYVHFEGSKPNPWENGGSYDILIIPSLYEGFGLVGVEATLSGIPVIANNIVVLREVLDYMPENCFFDVDSPQSIIDAVTYVFDNYLDVYKQTSLHSVIFKEKYLMKKMIDKYFTVYINH